MFRAVWTIQPSARQIENGGERDDGFCGYNAITPGIPLMAARADPFSPRLRGAVNASKARFGAVSG